MKPKREREKERESLSRRRFIAVEEEFEFAPTELRNGGGDGADGKERDEERPAAAGGEGVPGERRFSQSATGRENGTRRK